MSWSHTPLKKLHIELSSICNAACPLCPRCQSNSTNVRKDLVETYITFDNFKKYFPIHIIKNLDKILYCGTMGDPITNKDLLLILNYVIAHNPDCEQVINTNGGTRTKDFWKHLGQMFNTENRKVTFSIDGLEDTNHLYRRNVAWQKLINNVDTFISNGGHARWEFLVFAHNEHQLETAKNLSQQLGFKLFLPKKPFGFIDYKNNTLVDRSVFDKQGNKIYTISQSNLELYKDNLPKSDKVEKYTQSNYTTRTDISSLGKYADILDGKHIDCASLQNNQAEIYVNSQGILFPCCYVGTSYDGRVDNFLDYQIKQSINNSKDNLDLNLLGLDQILSNKNIDNIFSKNWNKSICNGKIGFCAQTCGQNKTVIDRIYVD